MLVLTIIFAVIVAVLVLAAFYFGTVFAYRPERQRAIEARASTKNHQELFIFVNDLLVVQDLGYLSVFPDEEMHQRAKRLTATYREEIAR